MTLAALVRPALLASAAVTALAACQTTPTVSHYEYGQGLVETCAAEACGTLGLDYAPLADYTQLNALSHVTALMVSHTDLANLSDIAAMAQLRELHMGDTQVRDLSGLSQLGNLRLIHMQGIAPTSWEPLTQVSGLRELAVGFYGMSDVSFVANLPRLEQLYLANVGAEMDLSGLGRHRGLRALHLDNDTVADLSPLLDLPNLRRFSMLTFDPERHGDVIAQLRARGVTVDLEEPAVIVC
ncbi:hypothetical protein [Gymnodinialimonas hymeniacidonis]|uniref:hypothetical protein n=1 Tax=Gymnodinialimonas hymeniacidonis TaxID=3126508 RepID=UPI0034C68EB5